MFFHFLSRRENLVEGPKVVWLGDSPMRLEPSVMPRSQITNQPLHPTEEPLCFPCLFFLGTCHKKGEGPRKKEEADDTAPGNIFPLFPMQDSTPESKSEEEEVIEGGAQFVFKN